MAKASDLLANRAAVSHAIEERVERIVERALENGRLARGVLGQLQGVEAGVSAAACERRSKVEQFKVEE